MFKEWKQIFDDSEFEKHWGCTKKEHIELIKKIPPEKLPETFKKARNFLKEWDINKSYSKILFTSLLIIYYLADNPKKLTIQLEKMKKTVNNEALFKKLNEFIKKIEELIKEIEDKLEHPHNRTNVKLKSKIITNYWV